MANLFLFMMVSLDGYFEGPNHDISWHHTDEEFNDFAIKQTGSAGTLIFGRLTYELMASYWPQEEAHNENPNNIVDLMNNTPKIVISTTLQSADWHNTRLIKDNVVPELRQLKQSATKDLAIFGSSNLCVSLINQDPTLIDEFRLMYNPVALGQGTPFLQGIKHPLNLQLTNQRTFANANILLTYQPQK